MRSEEGIKVVALKDRDNNAASVSNKKEKIDNKDNRLDVIAEKN